jgi:purine-nucleoside phosphorylase
MQQRAAEAAQWLLQQAGVHPRVGVVLGSGLGGLAERLEDAVSIAYQDIPHFPRSTVSGHAGILRAGRVGSIGVLALQGRFHPYEGYTMAQVTFPIQVLGQLGVRALIVTNAAGGINPAFGPGSLMLIRDHINLMADNPLIGPNDDRLGPRFPDLTHAYDPGLLSAARQTAAEQGIEHGEGVYAATLGPSFETAAEIRFMATIGADAVGMSTVPEVIVANYLGMRVLGISVITNAATGLAESAHDHRQVLARAAEAGQRLTSWVGSLLEGSTFAEI